MVCDMFCSPLTRSLFPAHLAFRIEHTRHPFHMGRQLAHQQRRADAAAAQLGVGEIQVVLALGDVVGELVADARNRAPGLAVLADQVQAGDFRLFAAVEREFRACRGLAAGAHDRAVALVEPFRLHAGAALLRLAAFDAHAEHLHAVGQAFDVAADLLVHGVARVGAAQVGQAGAGDVAVGRIRVVDRGQQAALGGDALVGLGVAAGGCVGDEGDAPALRDRGLGQVQRGGVAGDGGDGVAGQGADAASPVAVVYWISSMGFVSVFLRRGGGHGVPTLRHR
jgi:hypothetical protein